MGAGVGAGAGAGAGARSAGSGARSNGSESGVALLGLNVLRAVALVRPRALPTDGGGGRRPFYKTKTPITYSSMPLTQYKSCERYSFF